MEGMEYIRSEANIKDADRDIMMTSLWKTFFKQQQHWIGVLISSPTLIKAIDGTTDVTPASTVVFQLGNEISVITRRNA